MAVENANKALQKIGFHVALQMKLKQSLYAKPSQCAKYGTSILLADLF